MSAATYVTVSREFVADCRVFRVERAKRRRVNETQTHDFFRLDAPDWVNVVALTDEDEVVFVRQERHGTESLSLELPGGMVDDAESPEQAALRELAEETGYVGRHPKKLGWVHPNPALQSNRCHTFLVTGAKIRQAPSPDENESLEVLLMPRKKLGELVRSGQVTHALMICAFHLLALSPD